MVFEFLIASLKFFAIFLSIFYVLLFSLFKVNIKLYKYYHYRNSYLNLENKDEFIKINKIFNPVFKKVKYFNNSSLKIKAYFLNINTFIYEDDKFNFIKK
jgi:hypothetical protein